MESNPDDIFDPAKQDSYNERFVRWQAASIEARGKVISLILTLSLATIAFVFKLIIDNHPNKDCAKLFLFLGLVFLLGCAIIALSVMLNRLQDLRETTKIANLVRINHQPIQDIRKLRNNNRVTVKKTHKGVNRMILFFGIGEAATIIGLTIEYLHKLF